MKNDSLKSKIRSRMSEVQCPRSYNLFDFGLKKYLGAFNKMLLFLILIKTMLTNPGLRY